MTRQGFAIHSQARQAVRAELSSFVLYLLQSIRFSTLLPTPPRGDAVTSSSQPGCVRSWLESPTPEGVGASQHTSGGLRSTHAHEMTMGRANATNHPLSMITAIRRSSLPEDKHFPFSEDRLFDDDRILKGIGLQPRRCFATDGKIPSKIRYSELAADEAPRKTCAVALPLGRSAESRDLWDGGGGG